MSNVASVILGVMLGSFFVFAGYVDGYVEGRKFEEQQWRESARHVESFGFKFCRSGQEEGNG